MTARGAFGRGWILAAGILVSSAAVADEADDSRWNLRLGFQTLVADEFYSSSGDKIPLNKIDTHSFNLAVSYAVNERWSLHASIPYVISRFKGELGFFHDPAIILDPSVADEVARTPFIDDGEYHADFQDFHLGVTYHTGWNDLTVNPFVQVVIPSHDYPVFGLAAVGRGQKMLEVGAHFGYQPFLTNVYYRVMASHIWVEKVENISTNHFLYEVELGYFFSPKLSGRVFIQHKVGDGLDVPEDFPDITNRNWFYHDQTMSHEYKSIGLGMDYTLSSDYGLSVWTMNMYDGKNINESDYTLNLELIRRF